MENLICEPFSGSLKLRTGVGSISRWVAWRISPYLALKFKAIKDFSHTLFYNFTECAAEEREPE